MELNSIDLKILDMEIKDLKELLYILMKNSELTDNEVVKCSQRLDELILKYQKFQKIL